MENQAGQETETQKRKLESDGTETSATPTKKARVEDSTTGESALPGAATMETPATDVAKTDKKSPAKPAATRKYVYRDDEDDDSDSLEYKDDENDEDFAFGEEGDEDSDSVSDGDQSDSH